jgi:GTP-binding protein
LSGARRAIVNAMAGTTRDVMTHPVTWERYHFDLTDTGGMFGASRDPLHELVKNQGARALKSADLIVMVVDGREGLIPGDEDIAKATRDAGVPVILAINKTDDRRARVGGLELYRLGFDTVLEISAEHGEGVHELMQAIVDKLGITPDPIEDADEADAPEAEPAEPAETAIAIVGRPNAGKSSLVNKLLREDRMIVSEVPGTTRDSIDSLLQWHKRTFRIVDTAGIRKPGKYSKSQIESVSVLLARRAIERADVVVLVIDATVGPTDQDGAIAGAAKDAGRGVVIAANKWDLMKDQGEEAAKVFDENLRYQLKFLEFAPILHISAATGERTPKLLEVVDKVAAASRGRVPTGELNRFIEKITTASPPVTAGKRNVRVMYASQASVAPPTFVLFTNAQTKLHFSYERFLENRLREAYGFFGNPIRIQMRGRPDSRGDRKTASERAPERRSPVKKGPGSQPTRGERVRDAKRGTKRSTKHARPAKRSRKAAAKRGKR